MEQCSSGSPNEKTVVFLEIDDVIAIHKHQIETYGGEPGIRDFDSLSSAVSAPQATWGGELLLRDVFSMAAAYLLGINRNHPFVDGNKRASAVVAYAFLRLNGWRIVATETDFENMVLSVAKGETDRDGIAEFLRQNTELQT